MELRDRPLEKLWGGGEELTAKILFSFRLARRNVITKRHENWAWSQVTTNKLYLSIF